MTSAKQLNHSSLLIVDDDSTFTAVLQRSLASHFDSIFFANTVANALELSRDRTPNNILLDLKIHQSSGLDIIEKLLEHNSEVKIVVLTGYSSIATTVHALRLGALNYLCKPVGIQEILDAFNSDASYNSPLPAENPPSVERLEWEHIQKVLIENQGNISATARSLGMHRRTLQRKLQKKPVKQ